MGTVGRSKWVWTRTRSRVRGAGRVLLILALAIAGGTTVVWTQAPSIPAAAPSGSPMPAGGPQLGSLIPGQFGPGVPQVLPAKPVQKATFSGAPTIKPPGAMF